MEDGGRSCDEVAGVKLGWTGLSTGVPYLQGCVACTR